MSEKKLSAAQAYRAMQAFLSSQTGIPTGIQESLPDGAEPDPLTAAKWEQAVDQVLASGNDAAFAYGAGILPIQDGAHGFSGRQWAVDEALQFHRSVLANMTEGVSITDEDGFIIYTNAAEDRMFGYAPGELIGKHVTVQNAYEAAENARIVGEVIGELRRIGVWRGEWRNRRKNGEIFYTEAYITLLPLSGHTCWLCVQRDVTQQKTTRNALEAAERRLSILLESIGDHLVSYDHQWRYTYVNEGAARLLGRTKDELLGRCIWDLFPEAVGNAYYRMLHAAAAQQRAIVEEHYYAPWNAWFENRVYPGPDGLTVFSTDITHRKNTEDALAGTQARLQLALDAGGMGAWQWNIPENVNLWWPGMDKLHGLPPGTLAQSLDDYTDLVHADDREYVREAVRKSLASGEGHRIEYRIVWPDGSVHWVEGRGRIFVDGDGNPQQMAGICMDITRRKKTEQDLKFVAGASAALSQLVDHQETLDRIARLAVPTFADWCAVDLLDADNRLVRVAVTHVNPDKVALAHELHRRYPPDPSLPTGTWNVIRTGIPELVPEITDAMLEESVADRDYLAILKQLGLKSYIGAPLSAHGKTQGVITFITAESGRLYDAEDLALAGDLARRAAIAIDNSNLYRELQEADRRKDIFLATLAHELRNPLAPVTNALSLIKLSGGNPAQVEKAVLMMERQVVKLTRLVDDLMDVSRITTGKIQLRKSRISLATVLHNAIEACRPHIEAANHQLVVSLPEEHRELMADPLRLEQVFANLLTNAAKYTRPGGRIELLARSEPTRLVVKVRDNGIGIPPDMLHTIFTVFVQGSHSARISQGGLGIGLSLVEGLVGLHGGDVEAYSAGLEQGSEFTVFLPDGLEPHVHGTPPSAHAIESAAMAGHGGVGRILVVDDNADAANTVAEVLRMLGNEVRVAHDGLSGVAAAADFSPDIALLDIGLPGIDGYEVARRIRVQAGSRPVLLIALTGWGQEKDRQSAAEAGFHHHWVKPVALDKLKGIGTLLAKDAARA